MKLSMTSMTTMTDVKLTDTTRVGEIALRFSFEASKSWGISPIDNLDKGII